MKQNRVAYGVRVKLNSNFQEKCLGDKYLKNERILFIADPKTYNDASGEYVNVTGGSLVNGGQVYLSELDLEFEVPERPLYPYDEKNLTDQEASVKLSEKYMRDINAMLEPYQAAEEAFLAGCRFKEEQIRGNAIKK